MEKQMKKPQLRFPEFQGDWERKKLKEVSTYFNGGSFENDVKEEGKYELITLKSVDMSGNLAHSKRYLDIKVPTLRKNTLIMILSEQSPGLLGMTALIPTDNKYVLNQRVAEIRPNGNVESYFLSMAINRNQNYFSKHGAGTKVQNISKPNVENYSFLCPSLPEQTKIATFLKAVDEKLQALKKKHSLLEQYKKGVIQKLFSQELRFKDENGKNFPDWEEKMLGEVLIKNSIKNKNQKYSLVQSVSNKHGFINQDEMFEDRRVASKDTSNYYVIEKGHFAYNPSRIDVGSLAYKYDDKISVISPLYISFKANHKCVSDAYLLFWFSSEQFIKQMNGSFEGSVRNTLSYESLIKMSISLPKENEQEKISSFLIEMEKRIKISENEINKLKTWKKGLLQEMFC